MPYAAMHIGRAAGRCLCIQLTCLDRLFPRAVSAQVCVHFPYEGGRAHASIICVYMAIDTHYSCAEKRAARQRQAYLLPFLYTKLCRHYPTSPQQNSANNKATLYMMPLTNARFE